MPQLATRPPQALKQFGGKVVRLSPRGQHALQLRISAHVPELQVAYNRLSPTQLAKVLQKLIGMAEDAAATDAEAG